MFEEHLDEEYQTSEIDEEFTEIETQIEELGNKKKLVSTYDPELQEKLEKAIALLRLHVNNYQRIVVFNRRRSRQRLKKRQTSMRNFFLQSLMEMQIRFMEMLPLAIVPQIVEDSKEECKETFEQTEPLLQTNNLSVEDEKVEDDAESLDFYRDIVLKFTEDQWLDTFHMPRKIFELICTRLKPHSNSVDMHFDTWIAMCIYMFATGSKYSSVAMLFNVEKCFVRQSLFKFIKFLLNEFEEYKPTMPQSKEELDEISESFERASLMPPCVAGVLNLFEIPKFCECVRSPNCVSKNLKVQICIDHRLLFRKVEITDLKPTMFLRAPNEVSHNLKVFDGGCVLPYFIVAPPGYPLRTWLMQKYENPKESWEYDFNKSFGSLNIFREVSLKRFFGRWHILKSTECVKPDAKSFIIQACCLLHNLMESTREYFSLEWCTNYYPARHEYKITAYITKFYNDSQEAKDKRDVIAKMIRLRREASNCELT